MKQRSIFKRIACFAIAFALIIGMDSFALADSFDLNSDMEEYISTVLPRYLEVEGLYYDDVKISNGFHVEGNNNPNARTFFVFSGDQTIGVLNVTQKDGKLYSTFYFESNLEVENALENGTRIALQKSQVNNCNDIVISVEPANSTFSDVSTNLEYSTIELTPVTIYSQANYISRQIDNDSDYYVYLSELPYISNTTINNVGICWAACVASIANYRVGTNYTASSLYYALKEEYGGTPEGTNVWYSRGYNLCNMSATVTSTLQWQTLYSLLSSGKPIIFRMTDGAFLFPTKHAIVLKMFSGGNDYTTYGFMDPNFSTMRTVYMTGSLDPNDFVYASGSTDYSWYGSVY